MSLNYGNEISRVLNNSNTKFTNVIWQQGKPPLDSELNFVGQLANDSLRNTLKEIVPSGFINDPISQQPFVFDPLYANTFVLNSCSIVVNGMVLEIKGTKTSDETKNIIELSSPSETANVNNIDFVFIEVWQSLVAPNPSTDNKPSAITFYKYGNVDFGGTNINDDLIDDDIGFETTKRVQTQYRIRVHSNVNLQTYKQGLGDPLIFAQGNANAPVTSLVFSNLNGDNSCWRAGNGDPTNDLNTVDGYVYAIPLCAVFRRNSSPYIAIQNGSAPNHNGATARTTGNPKLLTEAKLTTAISSASTTSFVIGASLIDSGFDEIVNGGVTTPTLAKIGSEIVLITAVNTNTSTLTVERGVLGTQAQRHIPINSVLSFYNTRPDGLFADQISEQDLLDLRNSISFGDWDYQKLLQSAVSDVLFNNLHTTWKQSASGSSSQGVVINQVNIIGDTTTTLRPHTEILDAPNGIRTTWSDACILERDITVLCDNNSALNSNGTTTNYFDTTTSTTWTLGADLKPWGFIKTYTGTKKWSAGSIIFLNLGGLDGVSGARKGLNGEQAVRFVAPYEINTPDGDNYPIKLRFTKGIIDNDATPNEYSIPPITPLKKYNYEKPVIVLGGLIDAGLKFENISTTLGSGNLGTTTINGETFYTLDVGTDLTPYINTSPPQTVLYGKETIRTLITNQLTDLTGLNSEIYAVIYGSPSTDNNGVFKVVGMGSNSNFGSYIRASDNQSLVLLPLNDEFSGWTNHATETLTVELRTQRVSVLDGGVAKTDPSLCIAITSPSKIPHSYSMLNWTLDSKLLINCSLLYGAGRSGMKRVADHVNTIAIRDASRDYLKNTASDFGTTNTSYAQIEDRLLNLPTHNHIQLWNKLSAKGFDPNKTTTYGGQVIKGAEIDRESEVFTDVNSKTLIIRPFKKQTMTLQALRDGGNGLGSVYYPSPYGSIKRDDAGIFYGTDTDTIRWFFNIPPELLPKFGRQDIPYHQFIDGVSDPYLDGLHHLFIDSSNTNNQVFYIIGGHSNSGGAGVNPMLFYTDNTVITYGDYSTIKTNHPAYGARKVSLNIPSSDFGSVLKGIELPPNLGFARVYGVFEKTDYLANTTTTAMGAFQSDRITPIVGSPTNLLKTDATKYTMFIRESGGEDLTGSSDDHTYILTEHSIDVNRVPSNDGTGTFDDYEYIIECSVFGFANGFINKNGYVIARRYIGTGAVPALSGSNPQTLELSTLNMVLPSPLDENDELYVEYSRTSYQGDPFHTRGGSIPNFADYITRYGQTPSDDKYTFNIRGQFESDGTTALDLLNPRPMQVLASLDFYLTLGTGALGGQLYSSTITDVGFEQTHELPTSSGEPLTSILPSAFTTPLNPLSTNATASLAILDTSVLANYSIEFFFDTNTSNVGNVSISVPTTSIADLCNEINSNSTLKDKIIARYSGNVLVFETVEKGVKGNLYRVGIQGDTNTYSKEIHLYFDLVSGFYPFIRQDQNLTVKDLPYVKNTRVYFNGGKDVFGNAGNGNIEVSLVGLTTRLPLGILVNDYDFLCEDILNDGSSFLYSSLGGLKTASIQTPISPNGIAYTKINGVAGDVLIMSEGTNNLTYKAWTLADQSGTQVYRTLRGSSIYGGSGSVKGGALTFNTQSIPVSLQPVLKGGVLACKAMLVQNYDETAFTTPKQMSYGGEIQLVIVTQAIYRSDLSQPITLQGSISPSGYGEGYASADRYLIKGRPIAKNRNPKPSLNVTPAPYQP